MIKAFKFRLYPNEQQKRAIMVTFGCARVVYNACIDARNEQYKAWIDNGRQGKFESTTPKVKELKKTRPWLKEADSLALANAVMYFYGALKAYFDSKSGKRKGPKVRFPKHKKRGKCRYSYSTANQTGNVRLNEDGTMIHLPKLKWVNCVKHRELPKDGVIKRVYVSMTKSGKFHVTLNVECTDKGPLINKAAHAQNPRIVGLDMSLPHFCVSSEPEDDAITKYVGQYRMEERRLAALQRSMSRKVKTATIVVDGKEAEVEAPHYRKAREKYARACEKVSNRRREFIIRMARHFAMKYDVVCVETLNMQAQSRMRNHGKSVMDLGWGKFLHWLEHECRQYDTVFCKVDKWYASSQLCSNCGHKNKEVKDLKVREWTCPECGAHHDRDRNAARNLCNYFIKNYPQTPEEWYRRNDGNPYACGDGTNTLRETVGRVLSQALIGDVSPNEEGSRKSSTHDAAESSAQR